MNKTFLHVIQNKEGPWALILTERLIITTKSLISISDGPIPEFINIESSLKINVFRRLHERVLELMSIATDVNSIRESASLVYYYKYIRLKLLW